MSRRHEVADDAAWRALRARHVGSSESAALLGCSPHLTRYQLWHAKADPEFGRLLDEARGEGERQDWGKRLEPVIAQAVAEGQRLALRAGAKVYWTADDRPGMGATLDYFVEEGEAGPGVVECKAVDWFQWKDTWTETEAPAHIEVQVQHQLAVTGWSWAIIAALVGGNDLRLYRRDRHPAVIGRLTEAVAEFWRSVENGERPNVEDDRDLAATLLMVRATRPDPIALDPALDQSIADLEQATSLRLSYERAEKRLKAVILDALGDHAAGTTGRYRVNAPVTTVNRAATAATTYTQRRLTTKENPGHVPSQPTATVSVLDA